MIGVMSDETYRGDAAVLGQVGIVLAGIDLPKLQVQLPRLLAEKAIAAWEREVDESAPEKETCEERLRRHQSGMLALIGLSIIEGGHWQGDVVKVDLDPVLIGLAVDAADDLSS